MSKAQPTRSRNVTLTALSPGAKVGADVALPRGAASMKKADHLFKSNLILRCDWSGVSSEPGTFEVIDTSGAWVQVGKLGTKDGNDQIVSIDYEVKQVHVARGPGHPGVRFAVKLIPITWLVELRRDQHDQEVKLGEHYLYKAGVSPELIDWKHSAADHQGKHTLVWSDLTPGQDYEMWVQLWDPNGLLEPLVLDPVIRTGGNIPTK